MSESETPRTDAAIFTTGEYPGEDVVNHTVARQLERDLAAAQARAEKAEAEISKRQALVDAGILVAETIERRAEKAEARILDLEAERKGGHCIAGRGDPPMDCDWPQCGCDPKANQVLGMLQECGWPTPQTIRDRDATIADLTRKLAEAERDAAIGRLVREKLTSGNCIPVERCMILASEVAAIAKDDPK